jgi:drug/metabolite transporter (DMT)-like permease
MIDETKTPSGSQVVVACILLLVCAISVGLMPNVAKLAFQSGSNPETVMVIRSVVAVAIVGFYIMLNNGSLLIPLRLLALAVFASISTALMAYTMMRSILYIEVGLATLIMFTHPFLVAIYYHFVGNSKLSSTRMIWSLVAFAGLGLALSVDMSTISKLGLIYAASSAIFATIMIITMVGVSKEVGGITTSLHLSLWALILFSAVLGVTGNVHFPTTSLGWLGAVGSGITFAVTFITFLAAVRLIGASRATLLTFTEPIFAILFAALMFGERFSLLQWAGVALVAFGLFMLEAPMGKKPFAAANT